MDRRVIDQCIKSGSDPQKPHSLEFVLRGSSAGLEQLQSILLGRGYTLVAFTPTEEVLTMAKSTTLDLESIFSESLFLDSETKRLGLEYDGWGCLAVS